MEYEPAHKLKLKKFHEVYLELLSEFAFKPPKFTS